MKFAGGEGKKERNFTAVRRRAVWGRGGVRRKGEGGGWQRGGSADSGPAEEVLPKAPGVPEKANGSQKAEELESRGAWGACSPS